MRTMEGYTKGINLGGWLSQFDKYDRNHFDTFITEEDIRIIASWGLDHVRVPIDYFVLENEDGSAKTDGYEYLDKCVTWCRDNGLHMIIDLHKTYGYSFDPLDKDDKEAFFSNNADQQRFYDLWRTIARRYASDSDIVAYELLNEIVMPSVAESWNAIALKAVSVIREEAPDTWVIFGGVCYNAVSSVPGLAKTDDPKVAYTFHCYEPMIFTHQGAYWVGGMPTDFRVNYPVPMDVLDKMLKELPPELAGAIDRDALAVHGPEFFSKIFEEAVATAEARNIPLYCGEYGVIELASADDTISWLKNINAALSKAGIGRAYWNYKEKDFGLYGDRLADRMDEVKALL